MADNNVKAGNGVYEPTDRAKRGVDAATAHMGGRFGKPFVGEGMHEGNTTPNTEGKTSTQPIAGGTPPTSKNQTEPGAGADNSKVKKGNI